MSFRTLCRLLLTGLLKFEDLASDKSKISFVSQAGL